MRVLLFLFFVHGGTSYGYMKQGRVTGWTAFLRRLVDLRDRYRRVQIECLDFKKIIEKYDSDNTFFYLDPPYVDAEHYYGTGFGEADHRQLAEMLKSIKGKFLLSYYPHPLLDELYQGFPAVTKSVTKSSYGMTVNSKSRVRPKAVEMLVRNY